MTTRFNRVAQQVRIVSTFGAVVALLLCGGVASATLIDHYEFEGNGNDSVAPVANGTVGGNVTFTDAQKGLGMQSGAAGGAANRITIAQANAFSPGTGDFTIAFWYKRAGGDTGDGDGILDAHSGASGYHILINAAGIVNLLLDSGAPSINILSTTALPEVDSVFHHYAFTVDRSGNAILYIDGNVDSTVNVSSFTGSVTPNQNLWIGDVNGSAGLDGILDDLRFYNTALSAGDVASLMVPEPNTALLLIGGLGLVWRRRHRHMG